MRGEQSGSGKNREDRNRRQRGNQGGGYEQADGSGQEIWQERARRRAQGGRGPGVTDWNYGAEHVDDEEPHAGSNRNRYEQQQQGAQRAGGWGDVGQSGFDAGAFGSGRPRESQGSTGMGAFADGEFQGGYGGMNARGEPGYGQGGNMRGGYGQGSGFAQSSNMGGYGQGASQQGGWGQSGSDQHSDERYGQHFGQQWGQNEQRNSPYGYGGHGSQQQQGGQGQFGSRAAGQNPQEQARGQHHGKGPKGYQRSDERIRDDVSERLYHDHDVDASDIEITVTGGEVTLSGTVTTREEKRRAEVCAEQCTGVKDVQNRLRVQAGGGSSMQRNGADQEMAGQQQGTPGQSSSAKDEGVQDGRTSVHTGA